MMHANRLLRIVKDPSARGAYAAAWALDCAGGPPQVIVLDGGHALPGLPLPENRLFLLFGAPGTGRWEDFLRYLPVSDQEQIARLRRPLDRWAVAAARASLRSLLAVTLDCLPEEVRLIRDIHGKPALDLARHGSRARKIHFNISHTRGLIAVALAGRAIGVDVEFVCTMDDMVSVAKTAFPDESVAALLASPSDLERRSLFFRFWTLGEAFIKATGEGFAQDLKGFAFSSSGRPYLTRVEAKWSPASRWRFGIPPTDACSI